MAGHLRALRPEMLDHQTCDLTHVRNSHFVFDHVWPFINYQISSPEARPRDQISLARLASPPISRKYKNSIWAFFVLLSNKIAASFIRHLPNNFTKSTKSAPSGKTRAAFQSVARHRHRGLVPKSNSVFHCQRAATAGPFRSRRHFVLIRLI